MADAVLVTARRLDDVAPFRPDALFLPNAVDYDYIQAFNPYKHGDLPDDWQPIEQAGKPVIGYSGSLIERFDYDLFRHLVNARAQRECRVTANLSSDW
jgi:hypothetical protein